MAGCADNDLLDTRLAHRGIAAIAHDCGFGDISGFNRAFTAVYGLKPSELRRHESLPDRRARGL